MRVLTSVTDIFRSSSDPVGVVRDAIRIQAEEVKAILAVARELSTIEGRLPPELQVQFSEAIGRLVDSAERLTESNERIVKSL